MSKNSYAVVVVGLVALIALAAIGAAVALEVTGNDSSKAWEVAAGAAGALVAIHVPSPFTSK